MRRRALVLSLLPLAGLLGWIFLDGSTGSAQPAAAAVTGRVNVRGAHASEVIVYVAGTIQNAPRAAQRHSKVRQTDLRFSPDLVAVPTGSTVDFPNEDRVFHNVFSLSRTKRFDLGLYRSGESRSVTFNRAGLVDLYCNIHPDMIAQIWVVDSAQMTITGPHGGGYLLPNVPAGTWDIVAQPRHGQAVRHRVTVPARGRVQADFEVEPAEIPRSHTRIDGSPYGRYR